MLTKIAKIAQGTCVRWKRKKKERKEQEDSKDNKEHGEIQYSSRLLNCTRCGAAQETRQETRRMQLRTKVGFRASRCKS